MVNAVLLLMLREGVKRHLFAYEIANDYERFVVYERAEV